MIQHHNFRNWKTFLASLALAAISIGASAQENYVVLISVDGAAAYHLNNKELHLPNLRELIQQGAWADQGSETVFPSMTLPSHATIVTGVSPLAHRTLNNSMQNRRTGEKIDVDRLPRAESIKVPTIFDAAKKKSLSTATIRWPQTMNDPSVDFNLLLHNPSLEELKQPHWKFLKDAGWPAELYIDWAKDVRLRGARDILLAQGAAHLIRKNQPRLMAFRVVSPDSVGHTYGADHYLTKAAVTSTDAAIGVLREAVKEAGNADKTTFIITADHGFTSVTREVTVQPLLAQSELKDRIKLYENGWTTFVELQPGFDAKRDAAALNQFFDSVLKLDGVAKVIRPEEFHQMGYPRYEEDEHVRGHYMIIANVDTYFGRDLDNPSSTALRTKAKPSHNHGYLPQHPKMFPWLVLSGNGIAKGKKIGHVRNHDIAPTIAYLLNLEMPNVEGKVLKEALQ